MQKGGIRETGDWNQSLSLACYVSLWHKIHFGEHFPLSAQRGQDFATMKLNPWRQLFTTHRVWYEFNIFLTSDYKKDDQTFYSAEHWILKLQSWFFVSQVEYWFRLHKLHFVYIISRMLRAQFSRTSDRVNVGSLSWIINFPNVETWSWKLGALTYAPINVKPAGGGGGRA